jgi:hypothetical protein
MARKIFATRHYRNASQGLKRLHGLITPARIGSALKQGCGQARGRVHRNPARSFRAIWTSIAARLKD